MGKLIKTTIFTLCIFAVQIGAGNAFISDSKWFVTLNWKGVNPGFGNTFTFKFMNDGSFEIPELGESGDNFYEEFPVFTIPFIVNIDRFTASWESQEGTINEIELSGFLLETFLDIAYLDLPVISQLMYGWGKIEVSSGDIPTWYSFDFSGFNFMLGAKLVDVIPDYAMQGDEDKKITINCLNTRFKEFIPCVSFDNRGIEISNVEVKTNTSVEVEINVATDAPRGKCGVIIDLGDKRSRTIKSKNAFEIKGVLEKYLSERL